MQLRLLALAGAALATGALAAAVPAAPQPTAGLSRDPQVAALQVGLRATGIYAGAVDGLRTRATVGAVRVLQSRAGIPVDGVVGPRTRRALGRFGRPQLGSRTVGVGSVGWDAAAVQFMLAWHGFPSGEIDGAFGPRTGRALAKFERWARLRPDGVVGSDDLAALRAAPPRSPITLRAPVAVAPSDWFGARGSRFHTGLDYPAAHGTAVTAAGGGVVTWAGPLAGGWGNAVVIAHGSGVRTLYAHLSAVHASAGRRVAAGTVIGLVGATGHATGPHLHFEVLLRGAAVDPLSAIR